MMTWTRLVFAAALLAGLSGQSPAGDTYLKEELRIPLQAAGFQLGHARQLQRAPLQGSNGLFGKLLSAAL
jgi:hypothetical protein